MVAAYCANGVPSTSQVSGNLPIMDMFTESGEFCVLDYEVACHSGPSNSVIGLGRGTLTAPVNAQACTPDRPGPNSRAKFATAWGTSFPISPNPFLRRAGVGGLTSNNFTIIWTWPRGLTVTPARTLLLWQISSTFGSSGFLFCVHFTE